MNLHVEDTGGSGLAVVFHPGLGCDTGVFGAQVAHLRPRHRVIAIDARGHGRSPRASAYTVDALVDDLDGVATRLSLPPFWLVGHSFSGAVRSAYAGR